MLTIVIAIMIAIYLLTLITRARYKFNVPITKFIRLLFFVSTALLVVTVVAGFLNVYPRGYWFIKVLFWIVVFLVMILFGFGNKQALIPEERFLYTLAFFTPLSFIPLVVLGREVAGIVLILVYCFFIGDTSCILYSDKNIRIEKYPLDIFVSDRSLDIYMKSGLISYVDTITPFRYEHGVDSLSIVKLDSATYVLKCFNAATTYGPEGIEEFRYTIQSK